MKLSSTPLPQKR